MTKRGSKIIFGKRTGFTFFFALAALAFVVLGCSGGSKGNFKPVSSAFYGSWATNDGTTLRITSDGSAFYKSGGTTLDNGAAEFDETTKTLKLSLLGISFKEFKVDQMPSGGKMKLDGVLYQTNEKGIGDSPTPVTGREDDPDMPSRSEIDATVNSTMKDFTEAVEKGDFADFRNSDCSKDFKNGVSAERFNTIFTDFIRQKKDLVPILSSAADMTPDYSPAPNMSEEKGVKLLNLKGSYATSQKTSFELQYISEDNDWKLYMIRVRVEPK